PADGGRIPNHKLSRSCSRRCTAIHHLDHSNSQIVRIPHRSLLSSQKATESYSCLEGNPPDSQKVETALERRLPDRRGLNCLQIRAGYEARRLIPVPVGCDEMYACDNQWACCAREKS